MANLFRQLQARQEKELNEFIRANMFFAFTDEQFQEGLKKLGIEGGAGAVTRTPAGGYVRTEKAGEFLQIMRQMKAERDAAITDPTTGRQFIYDMFVAVLADTEYQFTGDTADALELLGYTAEDIDADPALKDGLQRATEALTAAQ